MKQKQLLLIILAFSAVLLAACGGGAAPAEPQSVALEVVTHDMYYGEEDNNMDNPPVWTAPAGSIATISFDNQGTLEHNWAVIKLGADVPTPFDAENDADLILYETGLVPPGEQRTLPFQVPTEPGEYLVICTVAGHYPNMQGRLVVN
ncbi:MAG: plastocyanin/azurin family copper-binding protein [Candidatus Promineifilaceae bacterium]|jgi:uncharacterized cupredoxin-like copper-binding protein